MLEYNRVYISKSHKYLYSTDHKLVYIIGLDSLGQYLNKRGLELKMTNKVPPAHEFDETSRFYSIV